MNIQDVMENVGLVVKTTDNPAVVYRQMRDLDIEVAPVIDKRGQLVGLVRCSAISENVPSLADSGLEDELDEALDETFPASDPISPAR